MPVHSGHMAMLHACCSSLFQGWDDKWSRAGLDGICIDGTFDVTDAEPRTFTLWSPRKNTAAHSVIEAALACFPPQVCSGVAGELLAQMRSYFGLQSPVTVMQGRPLRTYLAPWLHQKDASEVEELLNLCPRMSC